MVTDVAPQSPVARSQSIPLWSKSGREVTPAPALHLLVQNVADESDMTEGTDVTMGTSEEDDRASWEFHTTTLPQPYAGFESSEDKLAVGVTSERFSISAPVSDDVSLTCPWVTVSDLEFVHDRRIFSQLTPPNLQTRPKALRTLQRRSMPTSWRTTLVRLHATPLWRASIRARSSTHASST